MKTLGRLLLGLFVALCVFSFMEGLLRMLLGPPPPPVRVFSGLEPRGDFFEEEEGQVTPLHQVHEASPGEDLPPIEDFPARSEDTRVGFIGGSSVHGGSGLAMDAEFPALVGQRLGIDVLNLAAPALDSHDLVDLSRELVDFDLDLVVITTAHNDFGNAYFQRRYGSMATGAAARAQAGLERLQIFCQLRRALGPLDGVPSVAATGRGFDTLDPTRFWAALRYLEANLRQLIWMFDRAGVPSMLVTPASSLTQAPLDGSCPTTPCARLVWQQAQQAGTSAERAALLRKARDLDVIPLRAPTLAIETIRKVAADTQTPLVDLVAQLPRANGADVAASWLFKDEVHYNRAGHKAVAELVAPAVSEALATR